MTATNVFARRPHDGHRWIGLGLTIDDAAAAGRALTFAADTLEHTPDFGQGLVGIVSQRHELEHYRTVAHWLAKGIEERRTADALAREQAKKDERAAARAARKAAS
jgi:hypothetical protein